MVKPQVQDSYKWVVLAISFMMMISFALSLQALPPLFELMMKEVNFSNSQAGILMGAYAIPGIFLPFIVAYLANRFDMKKMIIAALAIMIAGLVAFSLANSFTSLVIFRLVSGIGATVVVVLAPLLITMFFDQRNIGIAMGIFNIAVPLGTVFAANIFGSVGKILGWRLVLTGVAGFLGVVLFLVVFALSLQKKDQTSNPEDSRDIAKSKETAPKFKGSRSLWFLAVIWVLANFQLLSYITFGPQFYQSMGLTDQRASFLTSLIMLASVFLAPIIGMIFDKTGRKKPYLIIGGIMSMFAFSLVAMNIPGLPLWAVVLGIGFAPIPVFVFAHLPETVKPHEVGMGLGMLTVAANIGTTIGPPALGSILDQTGSFPISFMVLGAVSLVIIALSMGLKSSNS